MSYSFLNLAEEVLETAKKQENIFALTHEEIWQKAGEYNLQAKCNSSGKTPWKSIQAQIYCDMKTERTLFVKASSHPVRFALKKYVSEGMPIPEPKPSHKKEKTESSFNERELHPLLSRFVGVDPHFRCYTKTIYHEESNKHKRGQNHWLHPDLMGVYFPFDSYQTGTLDIIKSFYESKMKLFSFEMKKEITTSSLRECFFQAVSNSSWANEGYLVALKYEQNDDLIEEMRRLNNSFGIGFIQLDALNVDQSVILIPAKCRDQIDWDTLDRLIEENPNVKSFVDSINEDVSLQKVKNKNEYDEILTDEKIMTWVKEKKIK